jgi:CRISPR-associated protein Cas6
VGTRAAPGVSRLDDEAAASTIDIAFELEGQALPRQHRRALAAALERVLPWLAEVPGAGVHRLNVSAGGGAHALLSRRTRLTLRVPRERAHDVAALQGTELHLASCTLRLGAPHFRELRPHGTLYAHLVAADEADETAFLRAMADELQALGVPCRLICGRLQVAESDDLQGYSLMLDGLTHAGALRVLEAGLGRHRRLGCGVFVPHKSAVAVGA